MGAASSGFGGDVTIDNESETGAHIQEDYAKSLNDGLDVVFAKRTANVLALCVNCTYNSRMRVTAQICYDESVNYNYIPTTIDMARAIQLANASNDALWMVQSQAYICNLCCIIIRETPAGLIENQPVYYENFVGVFEFGVAPDSRLQV